MVRYVDIALISTIQNEVVSVYDIDPLNSFMSIILERNNLALDIYRRTICKFVHLKRNQPTIIHPTMHKQITPYVTPGLRQFILCTPTSEERNDSKINYDDFSSKSKQSLRFNIVKRRSVTFAPNVVSQVIQIPSSRCVTFVPGYVTEVSEIPRYAKEDLSDFFYSEQDLLIFLNDFMKAPRDEIILSDNRLRTEHHDIFEFNSSQEHLASKQSGSKIGRNCCFPCTRRKRKGNFQSVSLGELSSTHGINKRIKVTSPFVSIQ